MRAIKWETLDEDAVEPTSLLYLRVSQTTTSSGWQWRVSGAGKILVTGTAATKQGARRSAVRAARHLHAASTPSERVAGLGVSKVSQSQVSNIVHGKSWVSP